MYFELSKQNLRNIFTKNLLDTYAQKKIAMIK